ncbi:MAG: hypothetical protein ACXWKM_13745 [Phenylobacterium sp.]
MILAPQPVRTGPQAQFAPTLEMLALAPFAGFRLLGYSVAGAVLDWIDSRRQPLERTTGPMSPLMSPGRETAP